MNSLIDFFTDRQYEAWVTLTIGTFLGALIGFLIAWFFYKKSTKDLNRVIAQLPADIKVKSIADIIILCLPILLEKFSKKSPLSDNSKKNQE